MSAEAKMLANLKKAAEDLQTHIYHYSRNGLEVSTEDLPDDELRRYLRIPLGRSTAARALMAQLPYVVKSDAYLVIEGATGTGKGALAELVNLASGRRRDRFQRLNLAGYPPDLAWGHVIGHTADAFTGANLGKIGAYCLAHEGSLFLDEFDQIGPTIQTMFLDVTQRTRKHLRRVGSTRELIDELQDKRFIERDLGLSRKGAAELRELVDGIRVAQGPKVRLIFGVSTNLRERVEHGAFREDLYYRMNVLRLSLPALQDRMADFAGLVGAAITYFDPKQVIRGFCPGFYEDLRAREWPGNIRQLRNVIQAAVTYAHDGVIRYSQWLEPALQGVNHRKTEQSQALPKTVPSIRSLPKREALLLIAHSLNETISDRHARGSFLGASRLMIQQGSCRVSDTSIRKFVKTGELRWESGRFVLRDNRERRCDS